MKINTKFSSPNYSPRSEKIRFIIIHYTEMIFDQALAKLCDPLAKVSSHYLIKSNGEIFQLVDNNLIAWHAGESYWFELSKLNNYSIGIELENLGYNPYPLEQMISCVNLCKELSLIHNIPSTNIIGHSDIAPHRKIDPGPFFDWSFLAAHKLGKWHNIDNITLNQPAIFNFGDSKPGILQLQSSLKKIGYKIDMNGIYDQQTNYVVRAFQAHFNPEKIKRLGRNFYFDDTSKYSWDIVSDQILQACLNNFVLNDEDSRTKAE